MKYLVMECHDSYAVLLDEEGRFVKSANMGYEVGETVINPVLMMDKPLEKEQEKRKVPIKLVSGILAVAAMITLFFGYNHYQENLAPYSSIFMVINPEVEMVLNKQGEVLEVNGTNEDGVALVENYEPSSTDKTVVANELVDRAVEMGFLSEGGRVSIAIDTPDQDLFEQYGIELRQELDGRISLTIEITDLENRNAEPVEPTEPPKEKTPQTPAPEADSGYDDSGYDDSDDDDSDDIDDDDSDNDTDDDDDDDSEYDDDSNDEDEEDSEYDNDSEYEADDDDDDDDDD